MKKLLRLVKPGCGDECLEGRGYWGKDRGIWGMGQGGELSLGKQIARLVKASSFFFRSPILSRFESKSVLNGI